MRRRRGCSRPMRCPTTSPSITRRSSPTIGACARAWGARRSIADGMIGVDLPPADGPVRRVPFAPGDTETIVAFCAAHGGLDLPLLRTLLLELTSDPAGVFVIDDGAGTALVATVIDRVRNGADAANLEILGVRAPIAAASFASLVVEPAVAFARAGERRALQVPLQASLNPADGVDRVLRDAGFAHVYDTFEMRRPASAPAPAPPEPLPAGWSWAA